MVTKPIFLIDTREQTPLRFSPAVDVQIATLATGDYSVAGASELVVIERKSLPDLVQCVGVERERFLDQCRRMRDYPLRLLVVEAGLDDVFAGAYRSRMNPNSVIGTTIAIHVDYQLPTIWCGDAKNAAQIVERLLTRVWRKRVADVGSAA